MALSSIRKVTDAFGEEWTFYNDAGTLTFYSQTSPTPQSGFALPATDTAFDVSIAGDDSWIVVYLDADENPLRKTSTNAGVTWA